MRKSTGRRRSRLIQAVAAFGVGLILTGVPVRAATPPPAAPAARDGFVPLSELPPDEKLPAAPLVFGAYSFIWLAVLGYVGLLWRRLSSVEREMQALKRPPSQS